MRLPTLSNNAAGALMALAAFAVFSTHDVTVKKLGATYLPFQVVFIKARHNPPQTPPMDDNPQFRWCWLQQRSMSFTL